MLKRDPKFLKRVITCNEIWVHQFDLLTKQESSIWKHPKSPLPPPSLPQESLTGKIGCKSHDVGVFNHKGIIYQHQAPHGVTVNADHYIEALKMGSKFSFTFLVFFVFISIYK